MWSAKRGVERTGGPRLRRGHCPPEDRDYCATSRVLRVMVPPQEHLSDEAATRTIWALTYMVNLFRVWGGTSRGPASRTAAGCCRGELLRGLREDGHRAAAGALVGRSGNADDLGLDVHGEPLSMVWVGCCKTAGAGRSPSPPPPVRTTPP